MHRMKPYHDGSARKRAVVFQSTLSDGSHVYCVRVCDDRHTVYDADQLIQLDCCSEDEAILLAETIERLTV